MEGGATAAATTTKTKLRNEAGFQKLRELRLFISSRIEPLAAVLFVDVGLLAQKIFQNLLIQQVGPCFRETDCKMPALRACLRLTLSISESTGCLLE